MVRERSAVQIRHSAPHYGGCRSVGRSPVCDTGSRGFESRQPPHLPIKTSQLKFGRVFQIVFDSITLVQNNGWDDFLKRPWRSMSIEFSDLENKRILLDCEQADLISIYSIKDRNDLFCIEFWLDLVPSHIKSIGDYNNGNFGGEDVKNGIGENLYGYVVLGEAESCGVIEGTIDLRTAYLSDNGKASFRINDGKMEEGDLLAVASSCIPDFGVFLNLEVE